MSYFLSWKKIVSYSPFSATDSFLCLPLLEKLLEGAAQTHTSLFPFLYTILVTHASQFLHRNFSFMVTTVSIFSNTRSALTLICSVRNFFCSHFFSPFLRYYSGSFQDKIFQILSLMITHSQGLVLVLSALPRLQLMEFLRVSSFTISFLTVLSPQEISSTSMALHSDHQLLISRFQFPDMISFQSSDSYFQHVIHTSIWRSNRNFNSNLPKDNS